MDASAYLHRHGWTGGGLGYNQSGIKKPVLASQRRGFSGVGKKISGGQTDQWWLGLFDAGLREIESSGPLADAQSSAKQGGSRGPAFFKAELYRNFVKGEGLTGTIEIGKAEQRQTEATTKRSRKKASAGDVLLQQSSLTGSTSDGGQDSSRREKRVHKASTTATTKRKRKRDQTAREVTLGNQAQGAAQRQT